MRLKELQKIVFLSFLMLSNKNKINLKSHYLKMIQIHPINIIINHYHLLKLKLIQMLIKLISLRNSWKKVIRLIYRLLKNWKKINKLINWLKMIKVLLVCIKIVVAILILCLWTILNINKSKEYIYRIRKPNQDLSYCCLLIEAKNLQSKCRQIS